jgi:hypothetical protein
LQVIFFTSCYDPPAECAARFFDAYTVPDVNCEMKVPFGCLIDENIFSRGIFFPRLFKEHFAYESKKFHSRSIPRVKESNGDVTSGLTRPRSGRNRLSANYGNMRSVFNVKTVQDRQQVSKKHEQKTVIAPLTGDLTSGLTRPLATK